MSYITNLTTPEDYITHYHEKLKTDLDNYDIQLNKLGIIGYLLNILGWTQYDIKQYYDYLFNESFVATADQNENLYLHASIYNYIPSFAIPATATGSFIFDFAEIPRTTVDDTGYLIKKREVLYSNINFTIETMNFRTLSTYRFIQEGDTYYCTIYSNDGTVIQIPSSSSVIEAPFIDVVQVLDKNSYIEVPSYQFNTFYPYSFTSNDQFISQLDIGIQKYGFTYDQGKYDQFDIKYVKQFESLFSNCVFLKIVTTNQYIIEFGSGTKGLHVPNSSVKITQQLTYGSRGNINISTVGALEPQSVCQSINTNIHGIRTSLAGNYRMFLKIKFEHAANGVDPLNGEELRIKLLEYIQTRDILISELDYNNVCKKYMGDFKFLFRKSSFVDNIFYLCRVFRDKLQLPVKTMNHTYPTLKNFKDSIDYEITLLDGGELPIDEVLAYNIVATDKFSKTSQNIKKTISPTSTSRTVKLTWNPVPNAESYYVLGRLNDSTDIFWKLPSTATQFIDTGDSSLSQPINQLDFENNIIFYPSFKIDNVDFISPYIYQYDPFFDWYKGFLLYSNIIIYLDNVNIERSDGYDIPVFYFNIQYDFESKQTVIYINSHQGIDTYKINITLHGLNIISEPTVNVNENKFKYVFSDNSYGVIWKEFLIEIDVYTSTGSAFMSGKSAFISQIFDISDQLKLLKYRSEPPDSSTYITNIPVILKETYDSDVIYYLDKLYDFLITNSFKEMRVTCDEVQGRFLNTFNIKKEMLKYIIKQTYNFDIYFPLKMSIECSLDYTYIKEHNVDIGYEKNEILKQLAMTLQSKYTSTDIVYYNSQIVDLIHSNRNYIKQVIVTVTDSRDNIINNGIESIPDQVLLNAIMQDITLMPVERKLKVLNYTPVFWNWDINTLPIKLLF